MPGGDTTMKPLVIGIDSSTTACKAIAWDADGRSVAEGRATTALRQPAPHQYEQDADEWWRGMCCALREALDRVEPRRIEALCIAHQRESFVPVDADGMPLRDAILWLDGRSCAQVAQLEQSVGRRRFHDLTGKPLTINPSVTKILWLQQCEPSIASRAHKYLDAHAFLVHRLTGEFRTSLASADPMGAVDMRRDCWAAEWLEEVGLSVGQFVELVEPGAIIGAVSRDAATQTGLPQGLPVVAGAGDGQCAGLGANAAAGGRASLNLGTAVTSGTIVEDYVVDTAFRTLYAPIAGSYFLETVIQAGAFTVAWFVDKFAADLRDAGVDLEPTQMLEAAAAKAPPGAMGLMLVPYWTHAMTPYWDSRASGITVGWTGAHGREHLYRAILEGIAFEQRLVGEGISRAAGRPQRQYVALGGGSRSDLWCQIIADVTGVPVARAGTAEATCLGAAILAATAVGWYPDARHAAEAMTRTIAGFEPNPEAARIYDALYSDVYRHLFPRLRPLLHRLADIRDGVGPTAPTQPVEHRPSAGAAPRGDHDQEASPCRER